MKYYAGADVPMWRAAGQWQGAFFQMRRFLRYFSFDASGLWSYPSFTKLPGGDIGWFHLMFPAKPLKNSQRLLLFPPTCYAVTPCNSTELLKYEDLRNRTDVNWTKSLDKPVARYPTGYIGRISLRAFMKAENDLLLMYETAKHNFASSGILPHDFVALYRKISHPVFIIYLNYFVPQFTKQLTSINGPGNRKE